MGDKIKMNHKFIEWNGVVWICLAQSGVQLLAVARTVVNLLVE
jgi:hypothetical protein